MKFTIEGLKQSILLELGLDGIDAILIRWFIDFSEARRMVKKTFDGQIFYWVSYKGLLEDVPLLGIKKRALYNRLKKIVDSGLLERYCDKNEHGTFSYYRFNEEMLNRIVWVKDTSDGGMYSNTYPLHQQGGGMHSILGGVGSQLHTGCAVDCRPKDPSTKKDSSTREENKRKLEKEKALELEINDMGHDFREAFDSYVDMRKCIRKPMTSRAKILAIRALEKMAPGDLGTQIKILEQSVMYSWQGLFELKKIGVSQNVRAGKNTSAQLPENLRQYDL